MDTSKLIPKWPRPKVPKLFKKLRAPYRMVFIDDESLEEVASFRLTKRSVYILFSMLFVSTIAVTVCILLFTPLKYYIPGYGDNKTRMRVLEMRRTVDSLSDQLGAQQARAENIRQVINGSFDGVTDTTLLDVAKVRHEDMNSIIPKAEEIKEKAVPAARRKRR